MQEPGMPLVVILGLATVFVVLICIILMIKLMSIIINSVKKDDAEIEPQPVPTGNVQAAAPAIAPANQSMVVAAMAAAIAEDMGTDVSQLRIHSIRKT